MQNFDFQNATRIIFGKDVEKNIGTEIKKHSSNIMFVHYGDGLIEKIGIYDTVMKSMREENITVTELTGILPSPHLDKVHEGIKLCKEKKIDFILAVGGGSVMDTAKAIAAGVYYDGDVWDYFDGKAGNIEKAIPIAVIVTYPATGSETNSGSVITNQNGMYKRFIDSNLLRPMFCMLNPEHTYGLPPYLTACGIADMFTHALERYMSNDKFVDMSDRIGEAIMRSIIYSAGQVMKNPTDYHARGEIMYAALIANHGVSSIGKSCAWESHKIAHELTTTYGLPHGATLSIIFPAWIRYIYKVNPVRFAQFAMRVFDVDMSFDNMDEIIFEGVARMQKFFKELGLPVTLTDANISDKDFEAMAEKAVSMGPIEGMTRLTKEDVINIYKLAL